MILTLEVFQAFRQALKAAGCDYINISSGSLSPQHYISISQLSGAVRQENSPRNRSYDLFAVSMITELEQAEVIIANGDAYAIAFANGALYDPCWPCHAAAKLGAQVQWPKQ